MKPLFPVPSLSLSFFLTFLLSLSFLGACAPVTGDACQSQADCGYQLFCEYSFPGGYCTLKNCEVDGCPEEGVCVRFSEDESWCMAACKSSKDCRRDYVCVEDYGPHPFCNDARGASTLED